MPPLSSIARRPTITDVAAHAGVSKALVSLALRGEPGPNAGTRERVLAADDQGVGQAVDHLVALGHRDIVHVDGGRNTIAAVRRRGYRAAMEAHGLAPRVLAGDLTERAGAAAAAALLAGPLPTAIVA